MVISLQSKFIIGKSGDAMGQKKRPLSGKGRGEMERKWQLALDLEKKLAAMVEKAFDRLDALEDRLESGGKTGENIEQEISGIKDELSMLKDAETHLNVLKEMGDKLKMAEVSEENASKTAARMEIMHHGFGKGLAEIKRKLEKVDRLEDALRELGREVGKIRHMQRAAEEKKGLAERFGFHHAGHAGGPNPDASGIAKRRAGMEKDIKILSERLGSIGSVMGPFHANLKKRLESLENSLKRLEGAHDPAIQKRVTALEDGLRMHAAAEKRIELLAENVDSVKSLAEHAGILERKMNEIENKLKRHAEVEKDIIALSGKISHVHSSIRKKMEEAENGQKAIWDENLHRQEEIEMNIEALSERIDSGRAAAESNIANLQKIVEGVQERLGKEDGMREEMATLAENVNALKSSLEPAAEDMQKKIKGVESGLKRLDVMEKAASEISGKVDSLKLSLQASDVYMKKRADALESGLKRLEGMRDVDEIRERTKEMGKNISGRLDSLESSVAAVGDVRNNVEMMEKSLSELSGKVGSLESSMETIAGLKKKMEAIEGKVERHAEMENDIRGLSEDVDGLKFSLQTAAELQKKIKGVESGLKRLEGMRDVDDVRERQAEMENSIQALSEKIGSVHAAIEAASAAMQGSIGGIANGLEESKKLVESMEERMENVEKSADAYTPIWNELEQIKGRVESLLHAVASLNSVRSQAEKIEERLNMIEGQMLQDESAKASGLSEELVRIAKRVDGLSNLMENMTSGKADRMELDEIRKMLKEVAV